MLDFQIPRITSESAEQNRGSFTIERLDGEAATVLLRGLACDPGDLEVEHQSPNVVFFSRRRHCGAGSRQRPMAGVRKRAYYFEYSSTMSCSCTGAATSRRSGLRSTLAVSDSWSACSHAGICPVSSVASLTTCVAGVSALIVITSPGRT